ncbi:MAG: cobalamin biosynthesis protein CbiX [Betaproteobacteria bacterium]|nr:cobalamin biosynthesis protein CbiX [Betaproteobacteria bacterium]
MKGIVLFAHGARDPDWALPFQRIRDSFAAACPDRPVTLAYLEWMQPPLAEAVGELHHRGATEIVVVPLFMAQGSHLKRDLPLLIEAASQANGGIAIQVLPPIGDVIEIATAIVGWIAAETR